MILRSIAGTTGSLLLIPSSSIQTTPLTSVRMAQNRIQRQAGMALPIVQLLVRKRSQRTIALALYDRVIGLVELVLAHS